MPHKRWYHAGKGGLGASDRLLPPAATGVGTSHRDHIAGYRSDRVYVTGVLLVALYHAANELARLRLYGCCADDAIALYEVEPEGRRVRDADTPPRWDTWSVKGAIVKATLFERRAMEFTEREADALDETFYRQAIRFGAGLVEDIEWPALTA